MAETALTTYRLVRKSPVSDPLGLHGTRVTAPTMPLALEYVREAGFDGNPPSSEEILCYYTMQEKEKTVFKGSLPEWIDAIDLGYVKPAVVFPEQPAEHTESRLPANEVFSPPSRLPRGMIGRIVLTSVAIIFGLVFCFLASAVTQAGAPVFFLSVGLFLIGLYFLNKLLP